METKNTGRSYRDHGAGCLCDQCVLDGARTSPPGTQHLGEEQIARMHECHRRQTLEAAAPDLLAQLEAFVEFANDWFDGKMPEDWRGRCVCANAAIAKATA